MTAEQELVAMGLRQAEPSYPPAGLYASAPTAGQGAASSSSNLGSDDQGTDADEDWLYSDDEVVPPGTGKKEAEHAYSSRLDDSARVISGASEGDAKEYDAPDADMRYLDMESRDSHKILNQFEDVSRYCVTM